MTFQERFGLPIEIGPSFVFAIEVMRVVAKDLRSQKDHPAVQAAIIRLEDAANVMEADIQFFQDRRAWIDNAAQIYFGREYGPKLPDRKV